jgi:hypothetical protein
MRDKLIFSANYAENSLEINCEKGGCEVRLLIFYVKRQRLFTELGRLYIGGDILVSTFYINKKT